MSSSMQNFQYVAPPVRLFHGETSLDRLPAELDRLKCSRAVVFCGRTLAAEGTLLNIVKDLLGDRFAGVISKVRAHSPVPAVLEAAEELKALQADAVIALGGGSAIVSARAASIVLAEGSDVRALATMPDGKGGLISPRLKAAKLPQFVIPTTPTTAAVKAGSAVFEPESGDRLALFDPKTRAGTVFLHPAMLASAPASLVSNSSVNTFSTAVEGLLSRQNNPLADAALMHSVRLLHANLGAMQADDGDKVRGNLSLAAVLCGQGTDHTGAGICTVLGHAIGAKFEVDNGQINAIVLPHVLRFNAAAAPEGMAKVAAALSLPAADPDQCRDAVVDAVTTLFASVNMPTRLRDVGVPETALQELADASMGDWFLKGNPKRVNDASELFEILEKSW